MAERLPNIHPGDILLEDFIGTVRLSTQSTHPFVSSCGIGSMGQNGDSAVSRKDIT